MSRFDYKTVAWKPIDAKGTVSFRARQSAVLFWNRVRKWLRRPNPVIFCRFALFKIGMSTLVYQTQAGNNRALQAGNYPLFVVSDLSSPVVDNLILFGSAG